MEASLLEAIKARLEGVTSGPWKWWNPNTTNFHPEWSPYSGPVGEDDDEDLYSQSVKAPYDEWDPGEDGKPRTRPVAIIITDSGHYPPHGPDKQFISHAREDIPILVSEVERLQEFVSDLQGVITSLQNERDNRRVDDPNARPTGPEYRDAVENYAHLLRFRPEDETQTVADRITKTRECAEVILSFHWRIAQGFVTTWDVDAWGNVVQFWRDVEMQPTPKFLSDVEIGEAETNPEMLSILNEAWENGSSFREFPEVTTSSEVQFPSSYDKVNEKLNPKPGTVKTGSVPVNVEYKGKGEYKDFSESETIVPPRKSRMARFLDRIDW